MLVFTVAYTSLLASTARVNTRHALKHQRYPQRGCHVVAAAAACVVQLIGDMAPRIALAAFDRRMALDQFAHVGLVKLSRMILADEMREEHRRKVLGE